MSCFTVQVAESKMKLVEMIGFKIVFNSSMVVYKSLKQRWSKMYAKQVSHAEKMSALTMLIFPITKNGTMYHKSKSVSAQVEGNALQ